MKGYPGVSISRAKNPRSQRKRGRDAYVYYKARIMIEGHATFLGYFKTPEKAARAYRKAKLNMLKPPLR